MSLNNDNYLTTIASERRQVARFQAGTVQQQLNNIREDISELFDMVDKLTFLYEKAHNIQFDPTTQEIISADGQPINTNTDMDINIDNNNDNDNKRNRPNNNHNPYL